MAFLTDSGEMIFTLRERTVAVERSDLRVMQTKNLTQIAGAEAVSSVHRC